MIPKFATRKLNFYSGKMPFELSRTKIEMFLQCKRCFYLDRKLGVAPPRSFAFNLNEAVDTLLKKEFDIYRKKKEPHPIMKGTNCIPYENENLEGWRNPFKGIRYHDKDTNFIVFGGIDDVWIDEEGLLHIVDYKATSKDGEVGISAPWQRQYKNQLEIYKWLFDMNSFKTGAIGYFVYANGDRSKDSFNNKLNFSLNLFEYECKTDWIPKILKEIKLTLDSNKIPEAAATCDLCKYRDSSGNSFKEHILNNK